MNVLSDIHLRIRGSVLVADLIKGPSQWPSGDMVFLPPYDKWFVELSSKIKAMIMEWPYAGAV